MIGGHKITYPAHYHSCIVADTGIMKDAPMELMRAGYGDVVGKYTALSDWRLTKAVNDEHYCEITARLVQNAVDLCVANTERYFRREEDAVERMNEALILTGISMGITGYTRPASGSEHHLAHYTIFNFTRDHSMLDEVAGEVAKRMGR